MKGDVFFKLYYFYFENMILNNIIKKEYFNCNFEKYNWITFFLLINLSF